MSVIILKLDTHLAGVLRMEASNRNILVPELIKLIVEAEVKMWEAPFEESQVRKLRSSIDRLKALNGELEQRIAALKGVSDGD